jgi:hypothetical protein
MVVVVINKPKVFQCIDVEDIHNIFLIVVMIIVMPQIRSK